MSTKNLHSLSHVRYSNICKIMLLMFVKSKILVQVLTNHNHVFAFCFYPTINNFRQYIEDIAGTQKNVVRYWVHEFSLFPTVF